MKKLLAPFVKPWLTILVKTLYTIAGKPYLKVTITNQKDGMVGVDAIYNPHFIYQLDNDYRRGGATHYDVTAPDNEKIAIYVYDAFGSIAENYIPLPQIEDEDEDLGANIPTMAIRGGQEVKQVVDIGKNSQDMRSVNIETGN